MSLPYVVGGPVWDRGWALDLWFDSVLANVNPAETGLLFACPPHDDSSREVISRRCKSFAFCEVLRDRSEKQYDRRSRLEDKHAALARARNQILAAVSKIHPDFYISWDSDLLIAPGVVDKLARRQLPVSTVWAWLNRQRPRLMRHLNEVTGQLEPVLWEEPMCATAMMWDPDRAQVAYHYPPEEWQSRARGLWRCDVVLAWQMMRSSVYSTTHYAPHVHGEDIPFNWSLHQRGIDRWCYGDQPGVHLFDRNEAQREIRMGYPTIMNLVHDKPLAAEHTEKRPEEHRVLGFFSAN